MKKVKKTEWIHYTPLTIDEMIEHLKNKDVSGEYLDILKNFPHKIDEYNLLCGLFGENIEINYFSSDKMQHLIPYTSFSENHNDNIKSIVDNATPYLEKIKDDEID